MQLRICLLIFVWGVQKLSSSIFNYLLLTRSREISDFAEWYYYIWHQGTDASFPITADETANGKTTDSIWRHKHKHMRAHTHTRVNCASYCVRPNSNSWDVVLMIYESDDSIRWSAGVLFWLPDSGFARTHTHTIWGIQNVTARVKIKLHLK